MTLVLTWINRDHAIQVSDRRLTFPDGSIADDDRTKAVCFCGRVSVAYTGPAELQHEDTAMWLAKRLAAASGLQEGLDSIAEAMPKAVARYPHGVRRFAVVATGWATINSEGPARAFIATVSNSIGHDGLWLARSRDRAEVSFEVLPSGQAYLSSAVGQRLTANERNRLDNLPRKLLKESEGPAPVANALGHLIWDVANGSDTRSSRVGSGLLFTSLSKTAVERGESSFQSGIGADFNGSIYLAPDGTQKEWRSPVLACDGTVMVGGLYPKCPGVVSQPPAWRLSAEIRLV